MQNPPIARRVFHRLLLGVGAALAAPAVRAQAWPSKPIRVVVPYPPGGFTDVTARLITQKLQERLGQTVVVDNKPGANGIIGADAVAKAAPDGYTFGIVIAAHASNTTLYPKLPYDPAKDLAAVSLIGVSPLIGAVNKAESLLPGRRGARRLIIDAALVRAGWVKDPVGLNRPRRRWGAMGIESARCLRCGSNARAHRLSMAVCRGHLR